MLYFCSMGTRVGLILPLSAVVAQNRSLDQSLAAVSPSGKPYGVIARLTCISIPQIVFRM